MIPNVIVINIITIVIISIVVVILIAIVIRLPCAARAADLANLAGHAPDPADEMSGTDELR